MVKKYSLLICCLLLVPVQLWADDIVRMTLRNNYTDSYQKEIIEAALINSVDKYGPYKLITYEGDVSSKRSFEELEKGDGELFNIRIGLTTNERESDSIPIRIPLRKGLQNYRLLLINKGEEERFKHITNIEDLKKFNIGLLYDWVTTSIMYENKFKVVESPSYRGMFRMLTAKRFDYTILGINEVYDELQTYEGELNQLAVMPGIVLYINAPSYVFISKQYPKIAERISYGLEKMLVNGEFDRVFNNHHLKYIVQANLASRIVINIPNAHLPKTVPVDRKALWLDLKK